MADELIAATERELERWPGVKAEFSNGGKHGVATLTYRGKSRMVVFAKTLSDNARGEKNHLSQVRRELRSLGAARIETVKSQSPARKRNKPVRQIPVERAPIVPNGFEKLAGFKPAEAKLTRWQRLWAQIKRVFT